MVRIYLILLSLLVISGCSNTNDYYQSIHDSERLQWQKQFTELAQQNKELQDETMTCQLQINQLQSDLKTSETLRLQIENQLNNAPKQQQLDELRQQLSVLNISLADMTNRQAEAQRRVNALAASEYELTRQRDTVQQTLDALRAKLDRVTGRTDVTCSTNLTLAKRQAFYEMWDIWVKTLED